MKNYRTIFRIALFSVSLLFLSCKKYETETLMVVKDCTHTYLRNGAVDLPVVNLEILEPVDSGEFITARYYLPGKQTAYKYGGCNQDHNYPKGDWVFIDEFYKD